MLSLNDVVYAFVHLDKVLSGITETAGAWTYVLLFAVLFCETGLVVTPFLPGDSLLFAVGSIAAVDGLNIWIALAILLTAVIAGDSSNYWIGHTLGVRFFNRPGKKPLIKQEHLDKTKAYFAEYGGKTVLIARFMPIVRTFAPFVAGAAEMRYATFLSYSVGGTFAWVGLCLFGGYFFGNIPFVKTHFSLVVLTIILISLMPGFLAWMRARAEPAKAPQA